MLFVISLGGSVIVPDEIDVKFLQEFKELITKGIKEGHRFIIVTGGGRTCRKYQAAAAEVSELDEEDLHWLGIHATRLNGHLVRTIFRKQAHPQVIKNPLEKFEFSEKVLVAAGWKPFCSTDYVAVLLALKFEAGMVFNVTNVPYVYDRDPKLAGAKPIKDIAWKDFMRLLPDEHSPGMNAPFDPVASRAAATGRLKVIVISKDMRNLSLALAGKPFKGTTIS